MRKDKMKKRDWIQDKPQRSRDDGHTSGYLDDTEDFFI